MLHNLFTFFYYNIRHIPACLAGINIKSYFVFAVKNSVLCEQIQSCLQCNFQRMKKCNKSEIENKCFKGSFDNYAILAPNYI